MKIKLEIILASILLFSGCGDFLSSKTKQSPNELFERLVLKPIPEYITDIEGTGYDFQDLAIYLKFAASSEFQQKLLLDNYQNADCREIFYRFELPPQFEKSFSKGWEPDKIIDKVCMNKSINDVGENYFVFDGNSQQVYFLGIRM